MKWHVKPMRKFWQKLVLGVGISVLAGMACQRTTGQAQDQAQDQAQENPAKGQAKASESQVVKVGVPLAGADEVRIEDLMRDPTPYAGKVVRVSGVVKDFCRHARAWFAIASSDGKRMVRVLATPRFQAPADCLEKQAVAEGTVEVQLLDEQQIEYFTRDHKFIAPEDIQPGQPLRLAAIRAFGAEFR